MQSKEQKIGELLANSVEDHFFNPAALGRYLAEQPIYTIDRIIEVVAWVIEKQARRYERELEKGGMVSEGLAIAHKLDQVIDKIKDKNTFEHVKLPITNGERKEIINNLPKVKETNYKYSWLHDTDTRGTKTYTEHPFI